MAELFTTTPTVNLISLSYTETIVTSISTTSIEIDSQPSIVTLTGIDLNYVLAIFMNSIPQVYSIVNPTTINVTLNNIGLGTFPFHLDMATDDFDTTQTITIYQSAYSKATTIDKVMRYGKYYGTQSKILRYTSR